MASYSHIKILNISSFIQLHHSKKYGIGRFINKIENGCIKIKSQSLLNFIHLNKQLQ